MQHTITKVKNYDSWWKIIGNTGCYLASGDGMNSMLDAFGVTYLSEMVGKTFIHHEDKLENAMSLYIQEQKLLPKYEYKIVALENNVFTINDEKVIVNIENIVDTESLVGKTFYSHHKNAKSAFLCYTHLDYYGKEFDSLLSHIKNKQPIEYDGSYMAEWVEKFWNNGLIIKRSQWIFDMSKWVSFINTMLPSDIWLEENTEPIVICKGQAGYFKICTSIDTVECIFTFGEQPISINVKQ
jgi:hypothetical protein